METPAGTTEPLLGGGEMGALMRSIDWSRTSVGAPSTWPQSLRTALSILLETGFPMYLAWGPEYTQFYNDGFRPILGSTKHPAAMGISTRITFAEIWEIIGPMFQRVMEGTTTTLVDFQLGLDRHGFTEDCFFIFSYSPIREEGGGIGGVFVTVTESTERVIGSRRLKTLQELSAGVQRAATAEAACEAAASVLGENPADLPFALLYLLDADGRTATLAGAAGIEPGDAAAPLRIDLAGVPLWPLAAVLATGTTRVVEELPGEAGSLPAQRAAVIPLAQPGEGRPAGVLVAAISPRILFDEKYLSFLDLAAGQIATAISNARALAEARARVEALAEIDRVKTTFFSNISHELRTPLMLILEPARDASAVGEGTAFTVRIPFGAAHLEPERIAAERTTASLASAAPAGSDAAAPFVQEAQRWSAAGTVRSTPAEGVKPRILLADDNADMRDYISRLLNQRYEVEAVADGAVALERARAAPPDLILSDIMMPGLDGYHLLQALRADERTRAIPILFVSARAGEESRVEGLSAGADDYLIKPFASGELLARVGTHLEISRLRVEAERARARLYSLFVQAPVPVCVLTGPELVYDVANPLYERMVGRSIEIGRPIREMFPELPHDAPVFQMLEEVYASGEPFIADDFRVPLDRQRDGAIEDVSFKLTIQPMRDAAGAIVSVMAIAVDVTSQVNARGEVEAARKLLETVVNQMPSGVLIAEAPSGRTLLANERVRSILGHPALSTEKVRDFGAYRAVHPDGRPFEAREYALTRALAGTVVVDDEIHYLRPDGSPRVLAVSASPVRDAEGGIVAAVNSFWDITDRKSVEERDRELFALERQARADAEVASRSKDEFLAMLGHELRNPLAPIVTALQLMRLRGDDTLAKERTVIERQVHHLIRLVDDLLDVSRITRGKVELKRERVEISEIVAKAIEMASPLIEQRQHRLAVDVPRQGLAVDADAVRMSQVVANLLNNAAKYTEPQGIIAALAERDGDTIVLRIRDTGIGLSAEMLARIFDLFVQERQAIDRAQGGLGLGLAIVRVLVELHGGTVEARSKGHGQGAELIVRLPAADAAELDEDGPASPARTDGEAAESPGALRVLVVDDNHDAAELLATTVQMMGHVARVAHDGPAGLRIAADFRPDLALLDIGLPVMDGYELARHLRALPGLEAIRLIAVTGYSQEADRAEAAAAGFEQHLVKPIRLEQLQGALGALKAGGEP